MYKDNEPNNAPLFNTGMVVWLEIPVIFQEFDAWWTDGRTGWQMNLWTDVHTDRQTEWGKVCWVEEPIDGRTDEMMDEGKRADYVPYEQNQQQ